MNNQLKNCLDYSLKYYLLNFFLIICLYLKLTYLHFGNKIKLIFMRNKLSIN